MTADQQITARHGITGRTEVIVFNRKRSRGRNHALTVVIERQGRGIVGCYEAPNLCAGDRDELWAEAFPAGSAELPPNQARERVARAILMTRIARRWLPNWFYERSEFLGNLESTSADIYDVYLCGSCEKPLDGELQVELAEKRGDSAYIICCPHCDGPSVHPGSGLATVHPWLARAWLMIAVGEPRRALLYAAHAERQRLSAAQLDAVRGAAMLKLSNPIQAVVHLKRAVDLEPANARNRRMLVDGLARLGLLASAAAQLDELVLGLPETASAAKDLRKALIRRGRKLGIEVQAVEDRCLGALVALERGDTRQAQELLATVGDDERLPATARVALEKLGAGSVVRTREITLDDPMVNKALQTLSAQV